MPLDPNKTPVVVQLDKDLTARLDRWRSRVGAMRPSAVAAIVKQFLDAEEGLKGGQAQAEVLGWEAVPPAPEQSKRPKRSKGKKHLYGKASNG